jgi:ATP-dependent Clp protease ATP-binding subunit ClpC
MAKKKQRDAAAKASDHSPDDVEAAVRAAAREVAERLGEYPEPGVLAEDEAFVRASDLLVPADVPVETVERLARSTGIVAAMAHRATVRRESVSDVWLEWAYKRLRKAYAGELVFLLEAIERHGEPPFVPRVLASADENWSWGWCLGVVSAFVERRVRAGEEPTVAALAEVVDPANEGNVVAVVGELDGVLPSATVSGFEEWRESRTQLEFFRSFGRLWEPSGAPPALTSVGARAAVLATLEATIQKPGARSVLLVGEHGVGKSAVLRELLGRLHREGWIVFEAGAAEVNAGQTYIGQLEGRVREIAEHTAGKRVLWVLPVFEETLWAGQHARSPQGLLDALLPFVEARQIAIVGELEPRAYELLVQQRPRVTSAFETLRLEPLGRDESIAVATHWRDGVGLEVDDETIGDAWDLAQHYIAGIAAPGRLLRLLKAADARAALDGRDSIRSPDILETLSEATGLPLHVVDPNAPLDLADVRSFFSSRVLGQAEAIDSVVDRIALIKAGLTDPTRPLGVFLFIGPTGTGKTELAKALAEFLFGSVERLVRLDMSEFQTERSFERLLADASSEGEAATLIASVRAKPFSVVLLDEFEKAHGNIWNLFLQVFDDGRLTDRQGRAADFRQCVIILTSNLGAAVERAGGVGFAPEAGPRFNPAAVERALKDTFRPEFINRIDRIVVFRPFEREQIRALLERELGLVLERRGFRTRPWAVEWDEAALDLLAEKGFSPELGARPLKRAVERYLLAPLATTIVSHSFPEGDQFLFITARDGAIEVTFVDPDAEPAEPADAEVRAPGSALRLEQLVLEPSGGRDESEFLQAETERLRAVVDGEDWRGSKERDLEAMQRDGFWESPDRIAVLARIEYVDRVQAAFHTAEKLVRRLPRESENGHGAAPDVVELLANRLYLLDRACVGIDPGDPPDAFLEIRASAPDDAVDELALRLRGMYEAWGRRRGMRTTRLPAATGGHRLAISGIAAYPILAPESGLHVFETPQDERSFDRVALQVAVAPAAPVAPGTDPAEHAASALREVPSSATVVRRYRTDPSPLVRDSVRGWRTGRLDRVLAGEFDVFGER